VAGGELNIDTYYLHALLLAGSERPRRPPPAAEDFDAYVEGAAHGLSSALGWAWEMIHAALDIALLTDADSAADFLAIALKHATPEHFPLEHVSFEPTSPDTGQLDLIEQALADTLGLSGRMITSSKSRYMHDHPDHALSFNANVCLASGKVAHGDLDLTLAEHRLVALAARLARPSSYSTNATDDSPTKSIRCSNERSTRSPHQATAASTIDHSNADATAASPAARPASPGARLRCRRTATRCPLCPDSPDVDRRLWLLLGGRRRRRLLEVAWSRRRRPLPELEVRCRHLGVLAFLSWRHVRGFRFHVARILGHCLSFLAWVSCLELAGSCRRPRV
jgi:hypothetical protein